MGNNIFKKLYNYIKEERAKGFAAEKERIHNFLGTPMTKEQVEAYNLQVAINSDFWLGGDWTEAYIKLRYLRVRDLTKHLTLEEYNNYYDHFSDLYEKEMNQKILK